MGDVSKDQNKQLKAGLSLTQNGALAIFTTTQVHGFSAGAVVTVAPVLIFFGLAFHDREAEVKRRASVSAAAETPTPVGP